MIQEEGSAGKVLVPISNFFDRKGITRALKILRIRGTEPIVVFHIVEAPQITTPLDPPLWDEQIKKAEGFIESAVVWLKSEGFNVERKVKVARDSADGIITEANNGDYSVVVLLKRRVARSWTRPLHRSISERVIRDANPPVLTLLAEEELAEKRTPRENT